MTAIIKTELLGNDFSAILNDASLQLVLDDVITAYRQGDTDLATLIANLRVDAREWFDEAIAAASTLDSGLQRTQLEAIVAQLRPWIAGRTVTLGGDVVTLESAFLMLTAAPQVAKEHFSLGADKLPAANLITFVDGRQTNMAAANADDGAGILTCTFSATDYYLGAPGEYTQKYAYSMRDVLGKQRKQGYVLIERSRTRFDLSTFLVAGATFDGLDLDGNGTKDGSVQPPAPAPAADNTALVSAVTAAQAEYDTAVADRSAKQTAVNEAQSALSVAQAGGDTQAIDDAHALFVTASDALATADAVVTAKAQALASAQSALAAG